MIEVVKYEDVKRGMLFKKTVKERVRIGTIGWPGDNRDMGISDLKKVREMCRLREEDGVDSDCFYSQAAMVDTFVNRYRTLLRRLARV
jgi:death-on-curing protein